MADLVVTIDGPAGSGKSTVARRLAERLGATFLDTGAMYRAVTLAAVRDGVDLTDEEQLLRVVQGHRFEFEAAGGTGFRVPSREEMRLGAPPNAPTPGPRGTLRAEGPDAQQPSGPGSRRGNRVGEPKMLVRVDGEDVTELIRDPELTAKVRHIAVAPRVRERLVAMQREFAARHAKIVTEGRDQGTVAFPDARIKFYLTADPGERARRRAAELQAKGAEADLEQIRQAIESRDRSDESRAVGPLKPAQDAVTVDTTGLGIEEVVEQVRRRVEEQDHPATPKPGDPPRQNAAPTVSKDKAHETLKVPPSPAGWYWFARLLCQIFCAIFFRYRAYGRERLPRTGSFVLASNHQSFLDPVFCGVAVKRHVTYMARDTLFSNRFFGPLIASVNAIPISRDKADIAVMRLVIDRLREGAAVCLFPEGTRTEDGRISPFKPGFGLLCRRSKAAVVPVLIDGAFECWPRHRKLFRPGSIVVQFGEPLTPEQVATMTNEQLADTVTQTLRQMQHEVRRKQGKPPYDYED